VCVCVRVCVCACVCVHGDIGYIGQSAYPLDGMYAWVYVCQHPHFFLFLPPPPASPGMSNHSGSTEGGHYIAHCRNYDDGGW
jgi:hypothetical protein